MESVVCTLFERHYHRGLVALVNSLYEKEYKGDVYAGYLGKLPVWAKITETQSFGDDIVETFVVNEDLRIQFVPLKTGNHLTNYKPDFMQWVLNGPAKDAERIFYFDPDIVINYNWHFFEEWVDYGVALCEDINSPLGLYHPRRMGWKKYFSNLGISLKFSQTIYANGGFLGLNKRDFPFIASWIAIQEHMAPAIGGLHQSSISGRNRLQKEHLGDYFPFNKTDQDALNITVGAWDGIVSFVGKEAMAFKPGAQLMFHALGTPKPWRMKFLRKIIYGYKPRNVDKVYWKSVSYPIKLYPKGYLIWKNLTLSLAAFIGRWYGRS